MKPLLSNSTPWPRNWAPIAPLSYEALPLLITAHEERLADEAMRIAYRDAPQDPIFIQAALQLARENTPPW